jgi:hypothetical protein
MKAKMENDPHVTIFYLDKRDVRNWGWTRFGQWRKWPYSQRYSRFWLRRLRCGW